MSEEFFPEDEIIESSPQEQKKLTISDDIHADIVLEKVKSARREQERLRDIYENRKKLLEQEFNKQIEGVVKQEEFYSGALEDYFSNLPDEKLKQNKSSKSYKLLSGTLRVKEQGPEFEVDSDKLVPWLEQNAPAYVKTKRVPDWSEFKKVTVVDKDKVVSALDGTEVPGITVNVRPDKFIIE